MGVVAVLVPVTLYVGCGFLIARADPNIARVYPTPIVASVIAAPDAG